MFGIIKKYYQFSIPPNTKNDFELISNEANKHTKFPYALFTQIIYIALSPFPN